MMKKMKMIHCRTQCNGLCICCFLSFSEWIQTTEWPKNKVSCAFLAVICCCINRQMEAGPWMQAGGGGGQTYVQFVVANAGELHSVIYANGYCRFLNHFYWQWWAASCQSASAGRLYSSCILTSLFYTSYVYGCTITRNSSIHAFSIAQFLFISFVRIQLL